ncbi:M28 family peptidase [Neobacillus sp. OS1-32]|jgi:hypothetical protein|uniref:M28 family peptidase n=1 Tax=Neobacillus sp. OS1-32 TaxID=3070682 RepID=UPI0027DF2ED2|nr:M28 family peptidase [Neobacillus sp. OS1-32]WML30317.1 M28 family peptidase [Neobacillus sp. OS1-32]
METKSNVTQLNKKKLSVRHIIFSVFIIFILLLVIWISLLQFQTPKVITVESTETDQFSAERAMSYLKKFAVKPHPLGSKEHDRVRDYLMKILRDLGTSPEIQSVDGISQKWGIEYEGKIENIVARIPGKDSTKAIMISSHYDSVENSPGASDAGSGVSAILETVRVITQFSPLKNDLIILITDGEEDGLLGARAFVELHPWAKEVGLVFNFDARGNTGPSILFETNEGNERLITEFKKAAPNPVAHSFLYDIYKILPNDTDFTIFKSAGMYGLNFGLVQGLYSYHTPEDKVENMDINSLQHNGENMVHLVQHFGNMNLVAKKDGNKIFFNVFGEKMILYSEKLVIPFMIVAILIFLLSFIHGYKLKKLSFGNTSKGFIVFAITFFLAFYFGKALWFLIRVIFHDYSWTIEANPSISIQFFACFILFLLMFIGVLYHLASKKMKEHNFTMGVHFGWLILVIITSTLYKGSSYIFLWPFLFGLIGLNIQMRMKNEKVFKNLTIQIIFAIPLLLIMVPVIYLVYILLTLEKSGILLALISLVGTYLLPILNWVNLQFAFREKTVETRGI